MEEVIDIDADYHRFIIGAKGDALRKFMQEHVRCACAACLTLPLLFIASVFAAAASLLLLFFIGSCWCHFFFGGVSVDRLFFYLSLIAVFFDDLMLLCNDWRVLLM